MIVFKYEPDASHQGQTAVKSYTMNIDDDADINEMCKAFEDFLKGMGYHLPAGSHIKVEDDFDYPDGYSTEWREYEQYEQPQLPFGQPLSKYPLTDEGEY